MIDEFAGAVFDALVTVAERMSPRLGDVAEHLREVARPPPGLELVSDDGAQYTGVVFVDRNKPIAALAIRVGEHRRREPERVPLITPDRRPEQRPLYGHQRSIDLNPDDPRWDYPNPYNR